MADRTGIERVLHRVRDTVEDGAYYEAQQIYKTIYHRYKAKNMMEECCRVLTEGATQQLQKGQINCGTELGNLLLETYQERVIEVSEAYIVALRELVLMLPKPEQHQELNAKSAEVEEGLRFITNIIQWIKKYDVNSEYYLEFNSFAGEYLLAWEGFKALGRITVYFARAKCWHSLAKVLMSSIQASGLPQEEDLFIVRCAMQVLLYTVNDNIEGVRDFLRAFIRLQAIPESPLIHFLNFLLEALQVPSENLVKMLKSKYHPAINRDPHLENLVDKIIQQFFPRESNNFISNLLGNILQSSTT